MKIHSRNIHLVFSILWISIILAEDSIIFNEINYNSADSLFPKDWVELYNFTTDSIDIGNWIFKDDNDVHEFIIPNNQILPPDGYIVICDSLNAFHISFPYVNNVIGDFDFKLRNDGELIRITDSGNNEVDSVDTEALISYFGQHAHIHIYKVAVS